MLSAVEMKGKIDKAVWVAQVHLHPVGLGIQVNCNSLSDNFHSLIDRLDSASVTGIVECLVEQIGETFREHLPNRNLRGFIVPRLESL